jgi:hypothetical protein
MCNHERIFSIMSHFEGGVEVIPTRYLNIDIDGWCPDCGALRATTGTFVFPKYYLHSVPPVENLPVCSGQGLHAATD